MINKIIISIAFFLAIINSSTLLGQQDPMYSQYMFNLTSVNPAYAGSKELLSALLLSRDQWVGFDGAPKTRTLTLHTPFIKKDFGLGTSIINDKIGPENQNSIYFDFAFKIRINPVSYLSMGLKSGFDLFSVNLKSLETVENNDNAFLKDISNTFMPNFGVGLFYFTDKYYLGLSTPRLLKHDLGVKDVQSGSLGKSERHYFFIGGYVHEINQDLKFKPTCLVKMVSNSPVSFDLTASLLIRETLWVGVMSRIGDSFGALLQYKITEQLTFGYAFDYTISKLQKYNNGTHEIMLSYDFIFKKDKVKSPRYF